MALPKKLTGILVAALVLGGSGAAQLAAAAPAAAYPPCYLAADGDNGGEALCMDVPAYRVVLSCTHDGAPYAVHGPIGGYGDESDAVCNDGDTLANLTTPRLSVSWEGL
ncbi:hypothetical protein GCM10009665_56010 [Kitasatospora nipponensis]|uniref:Secreted protein n=1 Tax=Kitasatospora nipponensis TaxID=258049 RepID=A0ABN1WPI1_9ACTN